MEDVTEIRTADSPVPALTRRGIIQAAVGTGLALALTGCGSMTDAGDLLKHTKAQPPVSLDLTGDTWTMQQEGSADSLPAIVPGSTYTDLLHAGKIPNPYYRQDNGAVQWVAEKNWIYRRTFDVPLECLARPHVQLKCHGLDTLATIWINGHKVGEANNMFRAWTFDIKPHLQSGVNTIEIHFACLTPYVQKLSEVYKAKYNIDLPDPRSWVRKGPYMWGWDWCRALLTQGIWKNIEIQSFDSQITDLGIIQNHDADGTVQLAVHAAVFAAPPDARVIARLMLAGKVVDQTSGPVVDGAAKLHFSVTNPLLWWPNGMGDHPLYTVVAHLVGPIGLLDRQSRRIGLRKIDVLPPKDGVAMHVVVNGVPVFVKGADWIPADNLPTRVTPETLSWYMHKAIECNFNFIRLWGGGYYEEDKLFDLCDELGIMLQFEFKFANDAYPVNDPQWMANLQTEIDQQVRRCRNHPSIVIWSGNNEIQDFKGYYHLFGDVIGGTVRRLLPGAFYEVGSGAAGSGDIHTWEVWHGGGGGAPYSQYRTIEGFVTEFGMQSFPVPATVDSYTNAADRTSIHSPVMRYHEMDGSGRGIGIITHYTNMYFGKSPANFDDTLWLTQINQAYGIRYGVEHWRRDMPRSMAATIWQYNDCWPGPTWSMTDYYRRWKAIQYQSKSFFAPILVSGIPDPKTGQVELHVTSDRQKDVSADLRWLVTSLAGAVLAHETKPIHIPARTSRLAHRLDLSRLISSHGLANLLIWPEVLVDNRLVAENTLFFVRPIELKLQKPNWAMTVRGGGRHYHLRVATDVPALWFWADVRDTNATYSDNFIHLCPGRTTTVHVTLDQPLSSAEFQHRLVVRSIHDIAPDMRKGA